MRRDLTGKLLIASICSIGLVAGGGLALLGSHPAPTVPGTLAIAPMASAALPQAHATAPAAPAPAAPRSFAWVAPEGTPSKEAFALRASLAGLENHGLEVAFYQRAFDQVQSMPIAQRAPAYGALLNGVLLDLHDGVSRNRKSDVARLNVVAPYREAAQKTLFGGGGLDQLYEKVAARHPAYQPLQTALADYRTREHEMLPTIAQGAKLKPGGRDARVPQIRAYMVKVGLADPEIIEDMAPAQAVAQGAAMQDAIRADQANASGTPTHDAAKLALAQPKPNTRYDEPLTEAVKAFQRKNGLADDGVIGKGTIDAMNVSPKTRVAQLAINLERLRRLPDMPADYVHVNIPSFALHAYHGGAETVAMKVIVGQKATPTPEFANQITSMVVNPTWTPTYKILNNEMLPKARRNPGSLNGFTVRNNHTGETVSASSVDWSSVSASDITLVQEAGHGNALGKVKFLMPASDSIYLHDTARPQLFSQSARALSHGCIRLEKPRELLEALMSYQSEPDLARAEKAYDGDNSQSFRMKAPMPVFTTYLTAFVDDDGKAVFYPDVYAKDDGLAKKYASMLINPKSAVQQVASVAPEQVATR